MPESTPPADGDPRQRFFAHLVKSLADGSFRRLVLARPHGTAAPSRIDVRRIVLRGEDHLSFVHHHQTNDVTKNHPERDGRLEVERLFGRTHRNVHLFTATEEWQLRSLKRDRCHLSVARLPQALPAGAGDHDRDKPRQLDSHRPFLRELGITNDGGQVLPTMARKWKQIDKFVEVFASALASAGLDQAKTLAIADFGAGKGYLTFAVHDWLGRRGVTPAVTGVELREALVEAGNATVARLGLQGLQFLAGDVRHHPLQRTDVLIALHACDTATDHALHFGIRSGAQVILAAPCCHKELRPQLRSPAVLEPVLRHGVYQGETAEMVTDALRALLLELHGYQTQVFEFVSLDHTAKNTMLLAVRRAVPAPVEPLRAQLQALREFYGIRSQCLETLLAGG